MATGDFHELRHGYTTAYATYVSCVQALSDASKNGAWPSVEVAELEAQAFDDLTVLRQALLDAMHTQSSRQKS